MPDVTSIGFTTKNRIFTSFWYQKCKNCKVLMPIGTWIWLKYSGNLLMRISSGDGVKMFQNLQTDCYKKTAAGNYVHKLKPNRFSAFLQKSKPSLRLLICKEH